MKGKKLRIQQWYHPASRTDITEATYGFQNLIKSNWKHVAKNYCETLDASVQWELHISGPGQDIRKISYDSKQNNKKSPIGPCMLEYNFEHFHYSKTLNNWSICFLSISKHRHKNVRILQLQRESE